MRVFNVDIQNRRRDIGALNAVARLKHIVRPDGTVQIDIDRSPLKANGQPGYTQLIWPESHASWNFVAVSMETPSTIYLNSALDVVPRNPIISAPGEYTLTYEVWAENFAVLRFEIRLSVNDNTLTTAAELASA